jgi:hypothetical protein
VGEGDRSDGVDEISVDMSIRVMGDQLGEVSGGLGDGGNKDDDVSQKRDDSRRLDSSLPSLNNLTSHCLFLLHFAAGD